MITPGYSLTATERVLPKLALNFLSGTSLDNRITFSRGSQATLTDSTGKLTYAPNNLFTNSESFENAAWPKTNASITANSAVAPDGTTTADTLIEDTANAQHTIAQTPTLAGSTTYTTSVYAKRAVGTRDVFIQVNTSGGTTGAGFASFNLANGTASAVTTLSGTFVGVAATATSVGNGWYRCSLTFTTNVGNTSATIYISLFNAARVYTGDGTSGAFLWGAQLEAVTYQTTPGTYNSTTPKNLLGFTQEFDNAAWTKSNSFVQTNLALQSEAFDTGSWSKGSSTIAANATTAPNGTLTADKLQETNTTAAFSCVATPTMAASTTYTFSLYMKAAERTFGILNIYTGAASCWTWYNLSTGVVSTLGAGATATIAPAGDGWYRCTLTIATAATGTPNIGIWPASANGVITYAGTAGNGIFIWGAQLVQGATAGDYQQTFAAAAAVQYTAPDGTRSADKLVETTAASTVHQVSQIYSGAVASGVYTFNVYLAKNERDKAVVIVSDNATGDCRVVVDLTAGTVGSPTITGNWTTASATIQAASGGFFRVSITCTKSASGNANVVPIVGLYTTSASYTGDGTSGIYIWGAQLSNSASLDLYVYNPGAAPSAAAYYGPRFDYPVSVRTNLLTYSEQFNNAAWTKVGTTITANTTIAPDGTLTADKIAESATSGEHAINNPIASVASTVYTGSVYVKASERTFCRLSFANLANGNVWFDLSAGTVGTKQAAVTTATITYIGNGWYRCTATWTANGVSNYFAFGPATADNVGTYTGVAGSGIFVWGAQLEQGSTATAYIPTVASAVTVESANAAGLLIEEQRSNLLTYSAEFDNAAWTKANLTVTANAISAPDGTLTGDKIVENTANGEHNVYVGNVSVASGTTYVASFYAKQGERRYIAFRTNIPNTSTSFTNSFFDLQTGTVVSSGSGQTASMSAAANGWYRCTVRMTGNWAGSTGVFALNISDNGTGITYTGDGTSGIFIWGAQLEAGAFATSYIPTVASTVTRSADQPTMSGANVTGWINQNTGTFVVEADLIAPTVSNKRILGVNATSASFAFVSTGAVYGAFDGTTALTANTVTSNVVFKGATGYDLTNKAAALNAGTVASAARSAVTPLTPVSTLQVGWDSTSPTNPLNGHIRAINYYPQRLINAELQAFTK